MNAAGQPHLAKPRRPPDHHGRPADCRVSGLLSTARAADAHSRLWPQVVVAARAYHQRQPYEKAPDVEGLGNVSAAPERISRTAWSIPPCPVMNRKGGGVPVRVRVS